MSLTAIFLLLLGASAPRAAAFPQPSGADSLRATAVHPVLDLSTGRLKVRVEDMSLTDFLGLLAERSGARIVLYGRGDERMGAELSDQPLEEGLRRLFRGYNLVIYYDSPSRDAHRGGSARLSEVRIFTGADPHAQAIVFAPPFPNANAQGATVPAAHRASSDPKEAFPAGRTSDRAVIESLSETLLSNNDSSVRAGAAEALGKTWDEGAVAPLSQSLVDDPSSAVREAAARALGRTWSEHAAPALLEALVSDRDARVREQAARALAQTAGEEAVEALARALVNDPRLFVRDAAAEALGTIGGRSAMDALSQAAVHDPDAWVRETAAEAALNSPQ